MPKRQKRVITGEVTTAQAEDLLARYAEADAKAEEITAKMDQQITRIREKYADDLSALGEVKEECFAKLQHYAERERDEGRQFTKRKSQPMSHGILGFRIGMPKLKTRKGFTWAAALELIERHLPDYVVTKKSPNKDRMLDDREDLVATGKMTEVGLEVVQDETFYIELKKEEAAA